MSECLARVLRSCHNLLRPPHQTKRQVLRDIAITLGLLLTASAICTALIFMEGSVAVPQVFVLAVLMTARFTDGYLYSLFAAIVSVFGVNYVFTYPYFAFNFTLTGYPITFLTMFVVSATVSMLTDQVKRKSRAEANAEREKMKANLLRSVSHDLRTPLTAIVGSASAVLENYDVFTDEVKRGLIEHVRDDAQGLIRLVENILSVTRIRDGDVRLEKTPQAAEEIAAEAVNKFKKRFPDMPVHVHVPDELLIVPMDATLVEQVLVNLMENVVLHAQGATHISLRLYQEGAYAAFCVEDDGAGIDPAILPRLFDEMCPHAGEMRGDGRRNLGIGLSVCKSIVQAHDGQMTAENRAQGGARFCFTLPREEGSAWQ